MEKRQHQPLAELFAGAGVHSPGAAESAERGGDLTLVLLGD
jgi:hypothetical protein